MDPDASITTRPQVGEPSVLAQRIIDLVTPVHQGEPLLGDLAEEFARMTSERGAKAARSWYWRQVPGTVAALLWSQIAASPLSLVLGAGGGFIFLYGMGTVLSILVYGIHRIAPNAPDHVVVSWGIDRLGGLGAAPLLAGFVAAKLCQDREVAGTACLAALFGAFHTCTRIWPETLHASSSTPSGSLFEIPFFMAMILAGGLLARSLARGMAAVYADVAEVDARANPTLRHRRKRQPSRNPTD
jgi:hypothetical protein